MPLLKTSHFPLEIVEEILQDLHHEDLTLTQTTLVCTARLSRIWCQASQPLLYRRPQIRSLSSLKQFLLTLEGTAHGARVQALSVSGFSIAFERKPRLSWKWIFSGGPPPLYDTLLDKLIKRCPNLIDLHLNVATPGERFAPTRPIYPRDYVAHLQTLSLGPSIHWLTYALLRNTIDCTGLVKLTLTDFLSMALPNWCPLPRLQSLHIVSHFSPPMLASLLEHVAQTSEELWLQQITLSPSYSYPTLPRLRSVALIGVICRSPTFISRDFVSCFPVLETMHLSNVNIRDALWPKNLHRLRKLTIGKDGRDDRVYASFIPTPPDVLILLKLVSQTLTHLEIYDTTFFSVESILLRRVSSDHPDRPVVLREKVEMTYFTPDIISCLPTMVALRSLQIACRQHTPLAFILNLPGQLETLRIHSRMKASRLEAMFRNFLAEGEALLHPALKEIWIGIGVDEVDLKHDWIEEWLRPRLDEAGIHLIKKRRHVDR